MKFRFGKAVLRDSLSFRLLTAVALLLTLITAVVVLGLSLLLALNPQGLMQHQLERDAGRLINGVHFNAAGTPDSLRVDYKMQAAYDAVKLDNGYRVLDQSGHVLLSSDAASRPYTRPGQDFEPQLSRFELSLNGQDLHVHTRGFAHGGQRFYVQAMRSERMQKVMLDNDSGHTKHTWIAAAVIAMAIFTLVVLVILHRMLKPLRVAAEAAAAIKMDSLSTRLSTRDIPSELTPLFQAFNQALERVEHGFRVQQNFLASAAHELKTPLALIRGQIELNEQNQPADRAQLLKDLDQMARQVNQLLHLAEASERQNYAMEIIDVREPVREAVTHLQRLAQRRQVFIVSLLSDDAVMQRADRSALFALTRNLLENALHHAPPGSKVYIEVERRGLSVRDHGPGIPPATMEMLFVRFWRGPERRDEGAGLGLSICQEIAGFHGWRLYAANAANAADAANAANGNAGAIFRVDFQA
ncbi:HAMP domain-containing sensor histidine kinase [Herbaspirillum lusitanum]|uniref:histidine kinase n=1 Tax=Herbaspirillum lusitanum TaxID=213312 RepID=A0ABW9AB11_9BURK